MPHIKPRAGTAVFLRRNQEKTGINFRFFVDFFEKMLIILNRMDTQNEVGMTYREILNEISRRKVVVGAKQLRKALVSGTAERVYLAENADPAVTEPILAQCRQNGVAYIWVRSMADLGRACGIEVGAAAAASVRESGSAGESRRIDPPMARN